MAMAKQAVFAIAACLALLIVTIVIANYQFPKRPTPFSRNTMTTSTGKSRNSMTISTVLGDASNETPSNCMDLRRKEPYPTSGEAPSGKNLCEVYVGTNRTDCVYIHPDIVHYVLFSSKPEDNIIGFREYLSIYSVDKFYKPEKIIIHCNRQPITGKYWELLQQQNLSTPIELNHTERIATIGTKKQKPGFISHEADYLKVKYGFIEGGIYSDFDVVILNGTKLREMRRNSELVIGSNYGMCYETCAGFFSSAPGSPFMGKWLDSYEHAYSTGWTDNAGHVPSKILHSCPDCYRDITVDYYTSNWGDRKHWLKKGKIEWRNKSVAHYMNAGFMKPFKPVKELLNMTTSFTEMIKHVLGEDLVRHFTDNF